MAEVLVVADHSDGAVAKPALELLTLARRIGDPVAVVFGAVDLTAALGEYGATTVLVVDDPAVEEFLVAPKAEALQQIAAERAPAAILISSTPEGKEIAGRLAVKLGSGSDHRRRRRGRRRLDRAVGLRRQLDRQGGRHRRRERPGRDHGQAQRGHPGEGGGRRGVGAGRGEHLRAGQGRPDRQDRTQGRQRPAGAHRGGDRRVRRPGHGWRLHARRRTGRRAGRRRGCLAGGGGLGLVPARVPGRADRQDGLAPAVRRGRHLRAPSSTGPGCRPPRRSSRSTRIRRPPSSPWRTSASSAI